MKNESRLSRIQISDLIDEAISNPVAQQQNTSDLELILSELNLIRGGATSSELNLIKGETVNEEITLADNYKSVNVWCRMA
jgi:hypothetical protein